MLIWAVLSTVMIRRCDLIAEQIDTGGLSEFQFCTAPDEAATTKTQLAALEFIKFMNKKYLPPWQQPSHQPTDGSGLRVNKRAHLLGVLSFVFFQHTFDNITNRDNTN